MPEIDGIKRRQERRKREKRQPLYAAQKVGVDAIPGTDSNVERVSATGLQAPPDRAIEGGTRVETSTMEGLAPATVPTLAPPRTAAAGATFLPGR